MTTISVPLPADLLQELDWLIQKGVDETRAAVMRRALRKLSEEEAIEEVLRAEREGDNGEVVRGDLKTLLSKIK